jgi:hypothetical protein
MASQVADVTTPAPGKAGASAVARLSRAVRRPGRAATVGQPVTATAVPLPGLAATVTNRPAKFSRSAREPRGY